MGAIALPRYEDEMELEYMLIDYSMGLIYGPYETFNRARERAEDFAIWEILNRDGDLVDWSESPTA
jgi:hypothetical protein